MADLGDIGVSGGGGRVAYTLAWWHSGERLAVATFRGVRRVHSLERTLGLAKAFRRALRAKQQLRLAQGAGGYGRPYRREARYALDAAHPLLFTSLPGVLSGSVLQNGSPLGGVRVAVFYRKNRQVAAATRSKPDGTWSVDGLVMDPSAYFAIAFDPPGAPIQNAIIYDLLSAEELP